MLQAILLVMAGASVGAALRFFATHFTSELSHHHGFPYGTLLVNVLGSFAVGYVLTWSSDHTHDRWRLLAATGTGWDRVEQVPDRLGHDRRYSVDWSKIRGELGYEPAWPLDEGLAATVQWYTARRDWWEPLKQR